VGVYCIAYCTFLLHFYCLSSVRLSSRVISRNLKLGGYREIIGAGGGVNMREAQIVIKNIKKPKKIPRVGRVGESTLNWGGGGL